MIRGVNKHIIEISDTGNDCFERAILFVRADNVQKNDDQIKNRAAEYLAGLRLRPWFYPRRKKLFLLLRLLAAALAGAGVTALLLLV